MHISYSCQRLDSFLPKIVSKEQSGFIPDRSMRNNIELAHDLVYDLDNGKGQGNAVISSLTWLNLRIVFPCAS